MSAQSRTRTVAGWLGLTVLATLLFGVAALWLTDRANSAQLSEFSRILQVVNATRLAQVHTKTQVQEWKNVLLRGQDAADFGRYLERFRAESANTTEELNRAASLKQALGLDASDVVKTVAEHEALMRAYEEALKNYQQGSTASIFAVDTAIRGRDRALNDMIDGLADTMRKEADTRLQIFADQDAERYQRLRLIFIALSVATLLLAGWLVVLTARP